MKPKNKRKQVLNCRTEKEEILNFYCDICSKHFNIELIEQLSASELDNYKQTKLKEHLENIHDIGPVRFCQICGFQTKIIKEIVEHR